MEITVKLVLLLLPVILINLALIIWCLTDWLKRKNFNYLPKYAWLIIFLFVQLIGPVSYLIFARKDESNSY